VKAAIEVNMKRQTDAEFLKELRKNAWARERGFRDYADYVKACERLYLHRAQPQQGI
jgi:hypothetical protein